MKNLNEYETPITDAMRSGIPHPKAVQIMLASHGDLERSLALCRDALAEIAAFVVMDSHDAGAVIRDDAKDIAREAFDKTK
jgi:hypothetical protein